LRLPDKFFGKRGGDAVCDIAYEQLQQLAAWKVLSHNQYTPAASRS
jgi:hypothetical protein